MASDLYRENVVQRVKETADITEVIGEVVSLKRSGANLKGLCPFHSEKTPSFMVNPDRHSFHCFGCGEGGDVFSFYMKYHNLSFPEALKELARKYQISLPEKTLSPQEKAKIKQREALYAANDDAVTIYHEFLLRHKKAEPARRYLDNRGIPKQVIEEFKLGYAPESWDFLCKKSAAGNVDLEIMCQAGLIVRKEKGGYYDRFRNRVLCPIQNAWGKTIAFGGRILGEGQPKYLNSPESSIFDKSSTLFGLYSNKSAIREKRQCIVVEGNFDLLSLVANKIKNVVAPLGTALTQQHIRSLKGYADEVILLFDGDSAGIQAGMRSVPVFLSEQMNAKIVILPDKHDPDTFIREQGVDALQKQLSEALSLPEFVFQNFVERFGLSLEGKSRIINELRPIIEKIGDSPQRNLFAAHFSAKLGLSPDQLLFKEKKSIASSAKFAKNPPAKKQTGLPLMQRQLLEFLLAYPEYLPSFLEADIEEVIDSDHGLAILNQLQNLHHENPGAGSEDILMHAEGPEKSIISELLISAPSYQDDEKEAMALEQISWLKKNSHKRRMKKLTMQINEAQQANNDSLWMELIAQKREMEKIITS